MCITMSIGLNVSLNLLIDHAPGVKGRVGIIEPRSIEKEGEEE